MSSQTGLSKSYIHRLVTQALKRVPNSNHVTETVCERFSGYLQVDVKYVSIRAHEQKSAFIWAIDYLSHDIVWWVLASNETYEPYYWMFKRLKSAGYQLKTLTCDDHTSIQPSFNTVFPGKPVQICLTHYKRNIQKRLDLRRNPRDCEFFNDVKNMLAANSLRVFHARGETMMWKYSKSSEYLAMLADIDRRFEQLTTHYHYTGGPKTTNLIEGFNKHLAVRLRSMDGFKSYGSAELWLNAYVMLRRTTPFESCKGRFAKLNGTMSLSHTAGWDVPGIYMIRE